MARKETQCRTSDGGHAPFRKRYRTLSGWHNFRPCSNTGGKRAIRHFVTGWYPKTTATGTCQMTKFLSLFTLVVHCSPAFAPCHVEARSKCRGEVAPSRCFSRHKPSGNQMSDGLWQHRSGNLLASFAASFFVTGSGKHSCNVNTG